MAFEILYLPVGKQMYNLEQAQMKLDDSVQVMKKIDKNILIPDGILLSKEDIDAFLQGKAPDFVIVQTVTYADASYITEILRKINCPVLLWSIPEPVVDGLGIRLNSLSGAYSQANAMLNLGKPYNYVVGSTFADETVDEIKAVVLAAKLKKSLSRLNLLQVGSPSEGMGFCNAYENEMMRTFGVKLFNVETMELMQKARTYDEDAIRDFIFDARNMVPNVFNTERENLFDAGKLFKAYFDYCNEHDIGAVASGCCPDFVKKYGTPVCAVLSILNDLGIPAACEADTYGALSVFICSYLSKIPAFFGDPVTMDEEYNSVTYWHCGMAPTSLAREDTKAQAGLHCFSGVGPVMDFGCRAARHATVFRIGRKPDGSFRFFIAKGESMDRFKQFTGTTVVIQTESNVREVIEKSVASGWEQHFVIAMADISKELKALAKMLNIDVEEF